MDAIGGDQFARFQIEAGPWFWHATEGHLLNGLPGARIHNGRDDTHGGTITGLGDCRLRLTVRTAAKRPLSPFDGSPSLLESGHSFRVTPSLRR